MKAALKLIEVIHAIQNMADDFENTISKADDEDEASVINAVLSREELPTGEIISSMLEFQNTLNAIVPVVMLVEDYLQDNITNTVFFKRRQQITERARQRLEDRAVSNIGPEVLDFLNKMKDE